MYAFSSKQARTARAAGGFEKQLGRDGEGADGPVKNFCFFFFFFFFRGSESSNSAVTQCVCVSATTRGSFPERGCEKVTKTWPFSRKAQNSQISDCIPVVTAVASKGL